jgi:UDP-glucose 4-epimerase
MQIKNKKILIVGGAGFIGSHLSEKLVNGNHVVSLDNYSTGSEKNHVEGVVYINGEAYDINEIFKKNDFDIIYHFGEYSRVEQSFIDYEFVIKNNLSSISKILTFCNKNNSKLIYSGSSTKFADEKGNGSASPYAWTKETNTFHIMNYAKWFGLNYAIVYFYNMYSGNEISNGKYATLIAKYKELYKKGLSLPVVLPGTQLRNFTHYEDTVDALILVGEKGKGDGYGIGSSEKFSVLDVAKMFGGEIEYLPERKGNRLSASLEIKKTLDLGWKQKHNLEQHINEWKKTI